jgi:riboflavin synthase alpha subunit
MGAGARSFAAGFAQAEYDERPLARASANHLGTQHVEFEAPADLFPEIAPKGSIAIDGVSLTVVEAAPPVLSVTLIPTTLRDTTLGGLKPGDEVNLETDLLAKYVRRALAAAAGDPEAADRRLRDALGRAGFME